MKRFNTHIRAMQTTLQERPEIIRALRVNQTAHVLLCVIDDLVIVVIFQSCITGKLIGVEFRTLANILFHDALKSLSIAVLYDLRHHLTRAAVFLLALQDSHYHHFANSPATVDFLLTLRLVHKPRLATDERFIYLKISADLQERTTLHSESDSVSHEPRRLLGNIQCPMNLPRADAVLIIPNHPCSHEPFIQRQGRILEDRADLSGKLTVTVYALALPFPLVLQEHNIFPPTGGTGNAIGPAESNHVLKAVVVISEVKDCFLKCLQVFHVIQSTGLRLIRQVYSCHL